MSCPSKNSDIFPSRAVLGAAIGGNIHHAHVGMGVGRGMGVLQTRWKRISRSLVFGVMLAIGSVVTTGCGEDKPVATAKDEAHAPVVKTADRGPIKLTVTASRGEITIAERLQLRIEVEADTGIEVVMPQFGEEMSAFQIRDFQELPPEDLGGKRRYVLQYDLDIFLSGLYPIPAITVRYRDTRHPSGSSSNPADGKDVPLTELSTKPFEIKVTSLLKGEFDPAKFRDVKGVATIEADRSWTWLAWSGAGVGVLILVIGLVLFLRRRRRGRPVRVKVIPPHEWAFGQLRDLANAGLIDAGRVREFHYRLSEIVRTYIELRFGLMAPERTTEEFLREMRSTGGLPEAYQPALGSFLEACDLVKYARYQPGTEEIETVFNTARDFVDKTQRIAPAPVPAAEAAAVGDEEMVA